MIKLYSTHCPQCNALETKLQRAGIEYEICDDREVMLARGFKAAPILETEEGVMSFSQAIKWVNSKK
jgi:glutaredoxin-related protein